MKIFVLVSEWRISKFQVEEGCSVEDLKKIIEEAEKIKSELQILIFEGKNLSSGQKLSELNVSEENPIILQRKYMYVLIQCVDNQTIQIDCTEAEPVASLKEKIEKISKIPKNSISLSFKSFVLQDTKTLMDYEIEAGSHIFLLIKSGIDEEKDSKDSGEKKQINIEEQKKEPNAILEEIPEEKSAPKKLYKFDDSSPE